MKVNFKVKMKVTIEFFVEIYFTNDLHFFEKYFTWGNIQPSRDFLDTVYIYVCPAFTSGTFPNPHFFAGDQRRS